MTMKFFVTGTDTEVGKTYVSIALLKKFNSLGYSTFGIKPLASGSQRRREKLYNEDALFLQEAASIKKSYEEVNPIALEPPIAPHIAAKLNNQYFSTHDVIKKINRSLEISADVFIIEGVGGWLVPLNESQSIADMVKLLNIPVVLVVGMKLGCLNHAILTVNAINSIGIPLVGWVANCLDPDMLALTENIQTLKKWIKAPCLGQLSKGGATEDEIQVEPLLDHFNKVVSPEENTF